MSNQEPNMIPHRETETLTVYGKRLRFYPYSVWEKQYAVEIAWGPAESERQVLTVYKPRISYVVPVCFIEETFLYSTPALAIFKRLVAEGIVTEVALHPAERDGTPECREFRIDFKKMNTIGVDIFKV